MTSMMPEAPFDRNDNLAGFGDQIPRQSGNISDGYGDEMQLDSYARSARARIIESYGQSIPFPYGDLATYLGEVADLFDAGDAAAIEGMRSSNPMLRSLAKLACAAEVGKASQ